MQRRLLIGLFVFTLAACGPSQIAEFWRPISEPNIQMSLEKAQTKLDFDLSQCRCGIFPTNTVRSNAIEFQPDKQRLTETSVTNTADEANDDCMLRPSLVVGECMRSRGWEVTNCSGRMPLAGGGALCAGYAIDNQ